MDSPLPIASTPLQALHNHWSNMVCKAVILVFSLQPWHAAVVLAFNKFTLPQAILRFHIVESTADTSFSQADEVPVTPLANAGLHGLVALPEVEG